MKKIFKKLLFVLFATATVFSFSACDDDDDDATTTVTQAQIEQALPGMWVIDLGDTYYRLWFSTTPDQWTERNGNIHCYRTSDDYVFMHSNFDWVAEGNTIKVTNFDDPAMLNQILVYTVLEITSNTIKIKGLLPNHDKVGTYTLKQEKQMDLQR